MKYLGIVKRNNCLLTMPDTFQEVAEGREYEAVQVGDEILLLPRPLDRERLQEIHRLASLSISEHRKTLEGLGR